MTLIWFNLSRNLGKRSNNSFHGFSSWNASLPVISRLLDSVNWGWFKKSNTLIESTKSTDEWASALWLADVWGAVLWLANDFGFIFRTPAYVTDGTQNYARPPAPHKLHPFNRNTEEHTGVTERRRRRRDHGAQPEGKHEPSQKTWFTVSQTQTCTTGGFGRFCQV